MRQTIGTFLELGGANVMECLTRTGVDYVIIDTEHGPFSVESTADCIRAAELGGLTTYVRIGDTSRPNVLRMLDIGVRGLIVPNIRTLEQVRELVTNAKFPPIGNRGYCPTRTSGWGADEWIRDVGDYMAACNRRCKVIPQCETKEALAQIEEIAGMEGVDGIFVGPCDLSIDLGIPLEFDHPELLQAIHRILNACKACGKETLIFAGNVADAKKWLHMGFDSVTYSLDASIFVNAYKTVIGQIKED